MDDKYLSGYKHGSAIATRFIAEFIGNTYIDMKKTYDIDYCTGLVDAVRDQIGNLMCEDIEDKLGN